MFLFGATVFAVVSSALCFLVAWASSGATRELTTILGVIGLAEAAASALATATSGAGLFDRRALARWLLFGATAVVLVPAAALAVVFVVIPAFPVGVLFLPLVVWDALHDRRASQRSLTLGPPLTGGALDGPRAPPLHHRAA